MSKFRNRTAETRHVSYGVIRSNSAVAPDGIVEVSDDIGVLANVRKVVKDGKEVVETLREAQTFADGYRCQPDIWEEVLETPKAASKAAPKEGE